MERQISAPRVIGDYAGYSCPVSGRWIEGRRAHEENLKRTGSRVLETGEHEANQRARKDQEAAFDREVDATVERFVDSLPSGKQEQLATEFSHGVDASVERRAYNPQE